MRGGIVCDDQREGIEPARFACKLSSRSVLATLQMEEVWADGGRRYFAARVPGIARRQGGGFARLPGYRTSPDVLNVTAIQPQTREIQGKNRTARTEAGRC